MPASDCTGACQSRALMGALTQVALSLETVSRELADRNIRITVLEERVNALSLLMEKRVLNREAV
jgi:hypothetical protein